MEYLHFYIKSGTATLTFYFNVEYVVLQYSYNKTEWTTATNDTSIELVPDKKVYFKGTISGYIEGRNIINFLSSGSPVYAGGSIMSLQNGNPDETTIKYPYEFKYLFKECRNLVSAPELPATTLKQYCYSGMFESCINLTTAPELPAMKLEPYCYDHMFTYCTHLTNAPVLPATTLAYGCYWYMFSYCDYLETAPALPATTLEPSCYASMFQTCSRLTNAPALPATNLADSCYEGMFYNTIYLTTAPELPATTLAPNCYERMFYLSQGLLNAPALPATTLENGCYNSMFESCRQLETAPILPATDPVEGCYTQMFNDCPKLNYVKCLLKPNTIVCTTDWLKGVSNTGTFVKNNETDNWGRNDSGIPVGWNVENYPPTVINYTLTVRGNNSRLTNGSSTNIGDATFDVSAVYSAGTSVTIGCKPKSGYRFVQWNDGNTNSERTVVVNSDITYTATVVKTYRIIAQDESVHHCSVRGTGVYDENSVAELTVVPFEGYMFSHWEDN